MTQHASPHVRPLDALIAVASLAAFTLPTARGQAPAVSSTDAASAEEIVHLEAFQVTGTIGSYHQQTSEMATKVPTDLKELSSSLQILNSTAIEDRNAVTLQDVFQYVVGITQSQQNVNGFTFRGIPNSGSFTQNIEYDGLQGGTLKKGAQSAADVEDIEFLKGPNSVLYGQMRPGGLLNIVTKSPLSVQEEELRTTFSTYAGRYSGFGSDNGETASLDVTGPIDRGRHWLYRFIVDAENARPYRLGDSDRLLSLFPSITYQWNADTYLTVKAEDSQDRRRTDDGLLPIFTDGIAYGSAARWRTAPLDIVYQDPTDVSRDRGSALSTFFHAKLGDAWTLRLQTRSVWHLDSVREMTNNNASVFVPKASFATAATTGIARQYQHTFNGHRYHFYDANAYREFGPRAFRNTFLVGVGGGQEFFDNQRYGFGPNVTPAVSLYDPILGQSPYPADGSKVSATIEQSTNFGAYGSDQIRVADRLHVTVGTRWNEQETHGIDVFKPITSPYVHQSTTAETSQAGMVYDLTGELSAYASWSQSFVPNEVTSVDATGHSGFAPEKGTQEEAGLKFETPDRHFYASAAGYWIERTNVLVATGLNYAPTGQPIFRLDGAQHSEGVELEGQWQPMPNLQFQGGVALAKAFVSASVKHPQTVGDDLANAPRGSGSLWTRYNVAEGPAKGLGIGAGVIYVGRYWGGDPTTAVYFGVPGYTRVDTALYYKWHRYSFALNLQNALDRKYILAVQSATALFAGDERKLTLTADVKF